MAGTNGTAGARDGPAEFRARLETGGEWARRVPLAAGMAAALPHMDARVEGHGLAAVEHLAAVVRGVVRDA